MEEEEGGATCSDTIEEEQNDNAGATTSHRVVDKKFLDACVMFRQATPFLNLCEEDTALSIAELNYHLVDSRWQRKEMQGETNLSVIQKFIVTVAREYDMSAFGRFEHLCEFIGAEGLQRDGVQILVKFQGGDEEDVREIRREKKTSSVVKERPLRSRQTRGAVSARTGTTASVPGSGQALSVTEEENVDPEFERFVRDKMEEHKAERLSPAADLRIMEGNYGLVREVMEATYQEYPQYTESQVKKLAEICMPNEHAVKNFLLLRYRRDNNGAAPPWDVGRKGGRKTKNPPRTPYNTGKGLGCSKCRYGANGCGTCGYWTEEDYAYINEAKAERERERNAKRQRTLESKGSRRRGARRST